MTIVSFWRVLAVETKQIYTILAIADDMGLIEINHKALLERVLGDEGLLQSFDRARDGLSVFWALADVVADRLKKPSHAVVHQYRDLQKQDEMPLTDEILNAAAPVYSENELSVMTWARQTVRRDDVVILDTETTGLRGYPIEVAVIGLDGRVLFDKRIKPPDGVMIDVKAEAVHGIHINDLQDCPEWGAVADEFYAVVRDKLVVIYNADFDTGIIQRANNQYDKHMNVNSQCLMQKYAEYRSEWSHWHGNFRWHTLSNACQQMGIEVENAHSALGDAKMTLKLLHALADKFK